MSMYCLMLYCRKKNGGTPAYLGQLRLVQDGFLQGDLPSGGPLATLPNGPVPARLLGCAFGESMLLLLGRRLLSFRACLIPSPKLFLEIAEMKPTEQQHFAGAQ